VSSSLTTDPSDGSDLDGDTVEKRHLESAGHARVKSALAIPVEPSTLVTSPP